jgi:hypothetical protein
MLRISNIINPSVGGSFSHKVITIVSGIAKDVITAIATITTSSYSGTAGTSVVLLSD